MLQLLHPAALWTLAAVALPLAIHLWRLPPRTVRLGSLRFLENIPRRPWRNLRWRELLLLGTRLGLLAALSLLLAAPRWLVPPPAGPRRWALLDPTAAPAGESLARWQAARRAGYEPHRLAPGFPAAGDVPSPDDGAAAPDLWSLLREADAELPAGSTLAVFSPARLAALRGTRPSLGHCKVEWVQTPAVGDAAHTWVARASGRQVIEGRSDARATEFTVRPAGEPPLISPAVSVLILHDDEHAADARYVEAAVRAAADSSGFPVNVQNRDITPDVDNAAVTDWTFWLSTRPVSEGLLARAPRLVAYAGGDAVAAGGWIVAPADETADGVRLWKRAAAPAPPGAPGGVWWSDGQGNPLLTYSRPAAGERWELFTRLDPGWTDLPRTAALPAWLRTRLFPEAAGRPGADPVHDRRLADPTQSLPADLPAAQIQPLAPADRPSRDLHWPVWTLAALLFAAERFLSLRRVAAPSAVAPAQPEPLATASR